MRDQQVLEAAAISRDLGTDVIGREVVCLLVCDSTNERALSAARAGAPDGAAFLANAQTAGRGRQGRSWLDQPGECVLLSVLLRPATLSLGEAHLLTMLAATATAAAVEATTGITPELKWPNDLVVGERKLAGILVETSLLGGTIEHAVVGIGLNANLDPQAHQEIAATATSLSRELGRPVDRLLIARELLRELDRRYAALRRGDRASLFAEWRNRLGTVGRTVELLDASGTRQVGRAEEVGADGSLVVRLGDGSRVSYHFAEVSLRGSAGDERG